MKNSKLYFILIILGSFTVLAFTQENSRAIKGSFQDSMTNTSDGSLISKTPRVIICTDFPPLDVIPGGVGYGPAEKRCGPDNIQSTVRFLLYSNEFGVEGLLAASATLAGIANKQNILDILSLCDQVDENLRKHDIRYPTTDQFKAFTWNGTNRTWSQAYQNIPGADKDSEASEGQARSVFRYDFVSGAVLVSWYRLFGRCRIL